MISEFPLFLFTTLSGIAAGACFVSVFFSRNQAKLRSWLLPLVCVVLLGVSAVCVWFHLGHMERVLNALANPSSMIAEEAYWAMLTGVFALVDCVMLKAKGTSPRAIGVLAALCGLVLMFITANAYVTSYAVTVWTTPFTWLLFVAGDLALGLALVGLFWQESYKESLAYTVFYLLASLVSLVGIAGIAYVFAQAGRDAVPFAVAIVLGPVASSAFALAGQMGKLAPKTASVLVFVLCLVGIALARYAFYAASIL